jgi:hypothetical protein
MTKIDVPSGTVARAASAPKMRFLYPLAAICIATVFMTPSDGQAQTASVEAQKQTETFKALGSTLGRINPLASPFGGKPARKLAEAQAAASIAGVLADAAAPAPEQRPIPPEAPHHAGKEE